MFDPSSTHNSSESNKYRINKARCHSVGNSPEFPRRSYENFFSFTGRNERGWDLSYIGYCCNVLFVWEAHIKLGVPFAHHHSLSGIVPWELINRACHLGIIVSRSLSKGSSAFWIFFLQSTNIRFCEAKMTIFGCEVVGGAVPKVFVAKIVYILL